MNIDAIVDAVHADSECRVLETNLFPYETPSGKRVPKPHRQTDVLKELLKCIPPKLIIAHGKKAYSWIAENKSLSPPIPGILLTSPHLSNKNMKWFATYLGQEAARNC